MPMHDWTLVPAGLYHHFHQTWIATLCGALNDGQLPGRYYALAEQITGQPVPDVIALERRPRSPRGELSGGGLALAEAPPRARFVEQSEEEIYSLKANRVSVRNYVGEVVAIIEIVSPGNKDRRASIRKFVEKTIEFIRHGVHVLVVDPFPPGRNDPAGIHKLIWDEVTDRPFELPPDKPLTVAAYCSSNVKTAYVDPIAVGDELPSLPIFLTDETYIPAPLESTYRTSFAMCPAPIRDILEGRATLADFAEPDPES